MTHRERVQTALAHEEPDRVPLEMSFTPEFAGRLRDHLFGEAGGRTTRTAVATTTPSNGPWTSMCC